ncbi:MAG: glyceraldehyde 3-phosphate dehydrogenase NAD-binding domain-containing protein, partial [Chitinophagaceae bacterium]
MRIAINGMGRIGRLLFRKLVDHPGIELVAVNDIMPTDNLAYLLKYDSVYGTFEKEIYVEDQFLTVAGKKIASLRADHPSRLPWKKLKV